MAEFGILKETRLDAPGKTKVLRLTGKDNYIYARQDGVFEPAAEIGEDVSQGQNCGMDSSTRSALGRCEEGGFSNHGDNSLQTNSWSGTTRRLPVPAWSGRHRLTSWLAQIDLLGASHHGLPVRVVL